VILTHHLKMLPGSARSTWRRCSGRLRCRARWPRRSGAVHLEPRLSLPVAGAWATRDGW